MPAKFPEWAAWCLQGWASQRERFERRWAELESDVWPAIERRWPRPHAVPADLQQQPGQPANPYFVCLDVGAWCGQYWNRENISTALAAFDRSRQIALRIQETASRLAELLAEQNALFEQGTVVEYESELSAPSDLWGLLERAAERYPDWKSIADGNYQMFERISWASSQSRPGPELQDLIEELADTVPPDIDLRRSLRILTTVRDQTAARIHLLDDRLAARLAGPHDPKESAAERLKIRRHYLTDQALATLAVVAYDTGPEWANAKQIGMLARRRVKRNGQGIDSA